MKKRCITMLLLFSFVMGGCGLKENAQVEESSVQEEVSIDVANQLGDREEIAEVLFEKELKETDNPRISELLNVSGTHFDGFNQDNYYFQIPQFNAKSESAKAVNERIDEQLSEIIEQEIVNISGGYSLSAYSVTYEIFEYGDIVAIVVTVPYPNDCRDYFAYTYDFQNDKEVTNKELLAMNMMTEEEFVTEVCRLQEADFIELAQSLTNPMTDQEMINEYITNVYVYATPELPMYFDDKGTLQVYVPFASIAGADWYYQLRQF